MSRLQRSSGRRRMIATRCSRRPTHGARVRCTWHRRSGASPADSGSRRSSVGSHARNAGRPRRPSTVAAGRPTWSCTCCANKVGPLRQRHPNPMAADLARRGSQAPHRRRRRGLPRVIPRGQAYVVINKIRIGVGRAVLLPSEGQAHVGVGTACVGCVRK